MKTFFMKKVFLLFLIAIFIQNSAAQTPQSQPTQTRQTSADLNEYGIKIQPDKRLMVVLAALEAAEIETALAPAGAEFRKKLRADLQNLNPQLRDKLKTFVDRHKKRYPQATGAEIIAPFVSLAFVLKDAPDLTEPARNADLPAVLLEVLDFAPLVREFYRSSGIEAKISEYTKLYQAEGDKMRVPTTRMASYILSYLHTRPELSYAEKIRTEEKDEKTKKPVQRTTTRVRERRFFIVPDLLAPAGTINFQNILDDYYVIVPANINLNATEMRRAYLQFVFDPLVLKNAKDILPFRDGIKQLLDERRKTRPEISPDVFLAVSRSLVAAADARAIEYQKVQAATADARRRIDLAQGVEAKKAVSADLAAQKQAFSDETALQLTEAYNRGAVLAFYFAEQLKGLEDAGFDIAASLRDVILSLNPAKENGRLAQFANASQRAVAAREASRNKNLELPKRLLEINDLIVKKNYAEAKEQLEKLLEENPNESRIYYNLGRLSGILAQPDITFDESLRDKRLDDAKAYYSNAIRTANEKTDPALIQLSYVALGRIYEFYDENETALKMYEAAIKIQDVEGGAYKEAVARKNNLTKKP